MVKKLMACRVSLYLGCFFLTLLLFSTQSGYAGFSVPVPAEKPEIEVEDAGLEETLILPLKKPAGGQQYSQSIIPLPGQKPAILKQIASAFLAGDQSDLYQDIFTMQRRGQMQQADEKIAALENNLLLGHVLAQRYLHPTTRAKFSDLKIWLDHYADHPQARRIYKLANARKPGDYQGQLVQPEKVKIISGQADGATRNVKKYRPRHNRNSTQEKQARQVHQKLRRHIADYEPTKAWNILDQHKGLFDSVEYDRLRAMVAAGYLYAGKVSAALKHAQAVAKRSGDFVPSAGWIKGLCYWQKQQYKKAAPAFEMAATSPYASGWMVSAAAYWASRAHMRSGNVRVISRWLDVSAQYPRTFYGLIATRALGHDFDFNWDNPHFDTASIEKTQAGKRARALIQIGQVELAQAELLRLAGSKKAPSRKALLTYANHHELPFLALRLGSSVKNKQGDYFDAALYPMNPWQPKSGYRVDKALMNAIIRQESKFNTRAQSTSGATGLMQLMPSTANYVADSRQYTTKMGQYLLGDPKVNLDIGQRYVETLLNHPAVGQDLLSMAIAYNAGPGKLSRWKRQRREAEDPLFFIETIPYAETRAFVERVLSNYWMYRLRFDQPTPSLDAVAEGRWARYIAMDNGSVKFAGHLQ